MDNFYSMQRNSYTSINPILAQGKNKFISGDRTSHTRNSTTHKNSSSKPRSKSKNEKSFFGKESSKIPKEKSVYGNRQFFNDHEKMCKNFYDGYKPKSRHLIKVGASKSFEK